MGEKVAATCLHLSQSVVSHSPSLSQKALASSALSPSSSSSNSYSSSRRSTRGKSVSDGAAAAALVRFVRSPPHPPLFFGINLPRSRSCEFSSYGYSRSSRSQSLRRSCSSSSSRGSDAFFDEEFAGSLQETTDDADAELDNNASSSNPKSSSSIYEMEGKDGFAMMYNRNHNSDFPHNSNSNLRLGSSNNSYSNSPSSRRAFGSEAVARGAEEGEMISASVEHKANSVDFPLSLRMLKRKKKQQQEWEEGEGLFGESSASASSSAVAGSCSVKKAFSSMVFMIRELHTYTLHMRETVFPHHQQGMGMGMGMDLQGVLARVRKEMHASFVWLFQHIFSSTPTLMVYVMILLANFTVYSMTATAAIAPPPRPTMEATTAASESHHHHIIHHQQQQRFDPLSTIKGRTASVGGSGGGGGKVRPMAGATDGGGDGRFEDSFDQHRTMFRDEMSSSSRVTSLGNGNPAAAVSEEKGEEKEELKLWNSIVEEASRMQGDVYLDRDTLHRLVSPVTVVMEPEDYTHYLWTDLLYQRAVSEEPDNPLILSNYAQFLYLVVHDLDRAEEMFKRSVGVGPPEADSLSRYASFLWVARNDLAGAEEKFLEAIEADPTNTIHAANYAHFLWNTGGEDTCYPLTS